MRALADQDPNDVSFYAPPRRRDVRLAQVSEVATDLAAERTERGEANGTSRLLPNLLGGVARSLDPEIVPPPPVPLPFKWGRWFSLLTAILAFIVFAFIGIGRFFPIATASRQQASDRGVDLPPPQQRVVAGLTKEIESPPLLLREWHGMSVERAPLAKKLHGRGVGMVLLSGLAGPRQ
jgi:hypothetical protein